MDTSTFIIPKYDPATGAGTLSSAAKANGITLQQLLQANPQYQANPNSVREGASIIIPKAAAVPVAPGAGTPAIPGAKPVVPVGTGTGSGNGTPVVPGAPAAPVSTFGMTPEQIAAQKATNDKTAAAAGTAGLSYSDLQAILANGGAVTQDQVNQVQKDLGITDLETKLFTPPSKTTTELYTDAFAAAGLGDVKAKITDLLQQVADKQNQLNTALSTIDENPWLSEASRTGKAARTTTFFQNAINALTGQVTSLQDVYNTGVSEVNNLVTRQTTDFQNTYKMNQDKLAYLQKKAEDQITQMKSDKLAATAPNVTDYLTAAGKAKAPQTIGSEGTGFFQYDPATGKFKQIIAPVAKTPTAQSDSQTLKDQASQMAGFLENVKGADGFISPNDYATAKRSWTAQTGRAGGTFDAIFSGYRNPNDKYNTDKVSSGVDAAVGALLGLDVSTMDSTIQQK